MRRALLVGTFLAVTTTAAHAQLVVADVGQHILTQLGIANQVRELANWVTQLNQMQQQFFQLVRTYEAFSHITDLGSAVSALGMLGIRNPLPVDPYTIQSMLSGGQNPAGILPGLSNLLNSTSGVNKVYTPATNSWSDQQNAAFSGGLANGQAVALQLYQSAADRIPLLQQLQDRISTSKDPAEREALIARIGVEQANLQVQQAQAANLGNYMAAQVAVAQQQQDQRYNSSAYAYLRDQQARGYINPAAQLPQ